MFDVTKTQGTRLISVISIALEQTELSDTLWTRLVCLFVFVVRYYRCATQTVQLSAARAQRPMTRPAPPLPLDACQTRDTARNAAT